MNNKYVIEILKNYIKTQITNRVRENKNSLGVYFEDNSHVLVRAKKTFCSMQRINNILKKESCDIENNNYAQLININNKTFIKDENSCKLYVYEVCDKLFNAERFGSLLFFNNDIVFNIEIEKIGK